MIRCPLSGMVAAVAACLIIGAAGCADLGTPTEIVPGIPAWLQTLISRYQAAPLGTAPVAVWQYQFKGETVYYVPAPCCDRFNVIYDAAGNVICAPDGGFSGAGDGRCPEFRREATNEVLVWRDNRVK